MSTANIKEKLGAGQQNGTTAKKDLVRFAGYWKYLVITGLLIVSLLWFFMYQYGDLVNSLKGDGAASTTRCPDVCEAGDEIALKPGQHIRATVTGEVRLTVIGRGCFGVSSREDIRHYIRNGVEYISPPEGVTSANVFVRVKTENCPRPEEGVRS